MNNYYKTYFSTKTNILPLGFSELLVNLFQGALSIAQKEEPFVQQRLAGIAMELLGESLFLSGSTDKVNRSAQIVERAKVMMLQSYNEDVNLQLLSKKLCCSYSGFRKMFKEVTGYSPADYLQEVKMAKARELLYSADLSIQEIAESSILLHMHISQPGLKKRMVSAPWSLKNDSSLNRYFRHYLVNTRTTNQNDSSTLRANSTVIWGWPVLIFSETKAIVVRITEL